MFLDEVGVVDRQHLAYALQERLHHGDGGVGLLARHEREHLLLEADDDAFEQAVGAGLGVHACAPAASRVASVPSVAGSVSGVAPG